MRSWKQWLANALLLTTSLLVTYYVLEVAVFRFFLPSISLNLFTHLPDTANVLVQNSKSSYLPRDYIALLGDSYAEGVGDWLLQVNGNRALPYHSANVIREITGRDVVSFGRDGNGSADAMVKGPERIFAGTRCFIFPTIEAPRDIVVYFYEGNDVYDNQIELAAMRRAHLDPNDTASIDRYLDQLAAIPFWKCHAHLLDSMKRMAVFAYQYHVQGIRLPRHRAEENTLVVGGREIPAPALQGPPLDDEVPTITATMPLVTRSIAHLHRQFPNASVTLIYLPSPLSIYRLAGEAVSYDVGSLKGLSRPAELVRQRSQLLCGLVENAAREQAVGFVDSRPAFRALAATTVIHGPNDWFHFNETGYRLLGKIVADRVMNRSGDVSCGDRDRPAADQQPS